MDSDARWYQDKLHKANTDRMDSIEGKLDRTLSVITEVAVEIRCIPDMQSRIKALEADRDQRKGAMALLGVLSGAVGAALGACFHYLTGK